MPDNELLSVEDRRKQILARLAADGRVRVAQLSRDFKISEVTIRNDLSELEELGLLERVHGGAVNTNKPYVTMSFLERKSRYREEKRAVAAAAARLVRDNDTVFINSGTTTFFLAEELKARRSLTVVTNSIAVAEELAPVAGFSVVLLGGNYNTTYQFTYGADALAQLEKYRTDKLILSADGVSGPYGLTTHHHQEAAVSRAMVDRARQVVVVADFTKIGRENFEFIAPADRIDCLVTNRTAPAEELALLREKPVDIITV